MIVGFVLAAVAPISHEVQSLVTTIPVTRLTSHPARAGRASRVQAPLDELPEEEIGAQCRWTGGVLGAGNSALDGGRGRQPRRADGLFPDRVSRGQEALAGLIPRSRRQRVGLLTDEVFDRVGGFMLGNLLTSLVSGVGTSSGY